MKLRPLLCGKALVLMLVVAQVPGLAHAHHSNTMFDSQNRVTLSGEVVRWDWVNPHTWLRLAVVDASGSKVEWDLESSSPGILRRNGWSRSSLQPGEKVSVTFRPAKDGTKVGLFGTVTRADGSVLGSTGGLD